MRSTIARLARAIAWRCVWVTSMEIVRSGPLQEPTVTPGSFTLARIRGTNADDTDIAARAMQAADDDHHSVRARLANGDELFGWQAPDGTIACFCWVRYRGRSIGPLVLKECPGRVFFYNAHTLPSFRGRGLYAALLKHMRSTLTREHHTEFIGDVNRNNRASRRGFENAGFHRAASITFVRLFQSWESEVTRTVIDRSMTPLF